MTVVIAANADQYVKKKLINNTNHHGIIMEHNTNTTHTTKYSYSRY